TGKIDIAQYDANKLEIQTAINAGHGTVTLTDKDGNVIGAVEIRHANVSNRELFSMALNFTLDQQTSLRTNFNYNLGANAFINNRDNLQFSSKKLFLQTINIIIPYTTLFQSTGKIDIAQYDANKLEIQTAINAGHGTVTLTD